MKDKEILLKVLEKAELNGFKAYKLLDEEDWFDVKVYEYYGQYGISCCDDSVDFKAIIFRHDFAKAFWGNLSHCNYGGISVCQICNCGEYHTTDYCWEYHLQLMVLDEKPLKYLEKFL